MWKLVKRLRRHANAAILFPFVGATITAFFVGAAIGSTTNGATWGSIFSTFAATAVTICAALLVAQYQVAEQRQPHVEEALSHIETAIRLLNAATKEGHSLRMVYILTHGSELNWLLHSTREAIASINDIRSRPAGHIPGIWQAMTVLDGQLLTALGHLEAALESSDHGDRVRFEQVARNCMVNGIVILQTMSEEIV
ncbi:MAG: hypothetical protein VR70_12115 [Rhodospirillaceae bacterium BRH_c57]|nr:MAG: hypothetical protein VR70_12115 [Rhodospirillaceae bacterium BRH_c57]